MMDTIEEIRYWFANGHRDGNAYQIKSIGNDYPAYVIRRADEFGVAVPYNGNIVCEDFANAHLYNQYHAIGNSEGMYLFLMSDMESSREEFAVICESFVRPGENGSERSALIADPSGWWKKWKQVIGNRNSVKHPYSVLGELLVYEMLRDEKKNPVWSGAEYSMHDIQTKAAEYEVKSTISHYQKVVDINGENQMTHNDTPLFLCFCRFEEDKSGFSINDIVRRLSDNGDDEAELDKKLSQQGFKKGASSRDIRYRLVEAQKYPVDESFPSITPDKFKDGQLPRGVTNLTYSVNLSFLKGEPLKLKNSVD